MPKIAHHIAAALIGFGIVAAIGGAPVHADPSGTNANGGSLGTGSTGAPIEKPGTGSPDYSTPAPKPSRGDYDTDLDYQMAVSGWRAGESARIANRDANKPKNEGDKYCILHPHDDACPSRK